MKIGSHDTMTYAKPIAWFLRPFHFVARCQSKTIYEQYEKYGCRLFDLRVRYNIKEHKWEFAHGCMIFKTEPVEDILSWLNTKGDSIVRIVLEYNRPNKNINEISKLFVDFCAKIVDEYPNIQFFEFTRKYDWNKLFTYHGEPKPDYYQAISSMTGKVIDDWFPWLYAWCFNKNIIEQGSCHEYVLMDFIGHNCSN